MRVGNTGADNGEAGGTDAGKRFTQHELTNKLNECDAFTELERTLFSSQSRLVSPHPSCVLHDRSPRARMELDGMPCCTDCGCSFISCFTHGLASRWKAWQMEVENGNSAGGWADVKYDIHENKSWTFVLF